MKTTVVQPVSEIPARPFQREGLIRRLAPFLTTLPFVFGWGIVAHLNSVWLVVSSSMTLLLIACAITVPWGRLPRWTESIIPLTAFGIIGMLNIAAGPDTSAYGTLVMMPVLWMALYHTRLELSLGIVGTMLAFLVPPLTGVIDEDLSDSLRRTTLWTATAAAVGLIAQSLVLRLLDSNQRMARITETANEAFIGMDQHGIITDWNRAAEQTFGYSKEEALGHTVAETIIPPSLRGQHAAGLERFLSTGESKVLGRRMELTALHQQGYEFPVELTISPGRSGDEPVFTAFLHDITERRRIEEQQRTYAQRLESVNHDLRRADEMKSQFVAMASHELRTPLTSIAGFSGTIINMWETLPDAEKLRFMRIIDGQAERLSRLVDDLLTLSRIEDGKLTTDPSLLNLSEIIDQSLWGFDAERITVQCRPGESAFADSLHIQQILVNYVDNAQKYGADEITVEVTCDEKWARIIVRDNGPGVPVEFAPHLFERFSRADNNSETSPAGTGLGLSIVRGLAQAQGGDVWYEPNTPTGSCFGLLLPATEPAVGLDYTDH